MRQSSFFDPAPLPAHSNPTTSKAAAVAVAPKASALRERVFAAIARDGGATDEEVMDATGLGGSTVRPRRVELIAENRVRDSGQTRPTRSGRRAIVWVKV